MLWKGWIVVEKTSGLTVKVKVSEMGLFKGIMVLLKEIRDNGDDDMKKLIDSRLEQIVKENEETE